MDTFDIYIEEAKKQKEEYVATTVRIPRDLSDSISDLTELLSRSKQEVVLSLVEMGFKAALKKINEVDDEENFFKNGDIRYYLLNTNKAHNIEAHRQMVRDGHAAAFYSPWKNNIERIGKGDIVFLYENGVGIVGCGIAPGTLLKRDYEGNSEECYYQVLENYVRLESPIPASEIKKIVKRNIPFLRTMFPIIDGESLYSATQNR